MSSTQSERRIGRAARSLGVDPSQADSSHVGPAACRFAGHKVPASASGRGVLRRLVERVDQVPLGVVTTVADLADAAEIELRGGVEQIPPLPDHAVDVVTFLDVLLSRSSPCELRALAQDLGVEPATARRATVLVGLGNRFADTAGDEYALTEQDLADLATSDRQSEGQAEAMLRCALRLHLADIGDAVLRASEWQPDPLSWRDAQQGGLIAVRPVPGAPNPLEARISVDIDHRDGEPAGSLVKAGAAAPARRIHRWRVGWRDTDDHFGAYDGGREASIQAAKFAAEVTVADLAVDPARVRMRLTGALLVPRSASTRNLDGYLVDLEQILVAVMNQRRGERQDEQHDTALTGWSMRPHRDVDGGLGSIIAVVFDHLCLPVPAARESACAAEVNSPEFAAFLTTHAVTLTPLARCYLAAMANAGPGERSLAERHAAGMRAALRNPSPDREQLRLELPPPATGYVSLIDVDRLESCLTTQHRPGVE